jgi:predicted AlkP superfamily pyrophosphatase or phosphodiesterase
MLFLFHRRILFTWFWCLAVLLPSASAANDRHAVLITIDGFAAYYLKDPQAPIPTIRKLAAEGSSAEGMLVSTPSVTWPNHTTLVTGVHPEKHSVLFNGVLIRPGPGQPVRVDSPRDKTDLVQVPTIYDLLHRAGLRTAGINWPCTRGATSLDDDFPDVPSQILHTTPRLRDELVQAGILKAATQESFASLSGPAKDQIWTAAAVHVIQKRRPHFLLVHLLITDSIQHKYGPQSPAAYTALALADAHVRDIVMALESAGIRERTTIIITADHGFESARQVIHPNVVFRKAGLLESSSGPSPLRARAQIISEGGIAMVYLTDPATFDEDRKKVMELLREHEGIAEILEPDRFKALGLPDPARNSQMAHLILVAAKGYAFSNEFRSEASITEVTLEAGNQGYHGFLSTHAKMNAAFIATGHQIRRDAKLGLIRNIDVAPTMARLLGKELPNADGRVLTELIENGASR